jgi:hypothetical protein
MPRRGRPLLSGWRHALCMYTYGALALVLIGAGCVDGSGEAVRAQALGFSLFRARVSPSGCGPLVIDRTHVWTHMCGDPQGAEAGAYAARPWGRWISSPADSFVGRWMWNAGVRTATRPQPCSTYPCIAPTRQPHAINSGMMEHMPPQFVS